MLKEDSPLVPYTKSGMNESTILLYKMARTDAILVRSILEFNCI